MIDFLLNEYYPKNKDEIQYIKDNITNKETIEAHIKYLSDKYKRFSKIYKANRIIIKFIPILALILFLVMPTFYVEIFVAAFAIIVLYELSITIFFPRKYYDKISRNILILKSIINYNDSNNIS